MGEHRDRAQELVAQAEGSFRNEAIPYDMQILLAIYEMLCELHETLAVRELA